MTIKNWLGNRAYWLKGGVLALMLVAIVFGVGIFQGSLEFFLSIFSWFDFIALIYCGGICKGFYSLITLGTIWPASFIIGAFIGWIYGKIETKGTNSITKTFKMPFIAIFTIIILVLAFTTYNYYHANKVDMVRNGYNIYNEKIYVHFSYLGYDSGSPKELKGIDIDTFKILFDNPENPTSPTSSYALDKNNVYFVTSGDLSTDGGQKKKKINLNDVIVPGADPKTFSMVGVNYAKDKNHVYCDRSIIKEADAETFKENLQQYDEETEETTVYRRLTETEQRKVGDIDVDAMDKNHYYFSCQITGNISQSNK